MEQLLREEGIRISNPDIMKIIEAKRKENQDIAAGKPKRIYYKMTLKGNKVTVIEVGEDEQDINMEDDVCHIIHFEVEELCSAEDIEAAEPYQSNLEKLLLEEEEEESQKIKN